MNFLVQLKGGQRREIIYCSLLYVCFKEDVGQVVDETISDILPKGKCELLTIGGDPVGEGYGVFEIGVYFSVCFFCDLSTRYKRIC